MKLAKLAPYASIALLAATAACAEAPDTDEETAATAPAGDGAYPAESTASEARANGENVIRRRAGDARRWRIPRLVWPAFARENR